MKKRKPLKAIGAAIDALKPGKELANKAVWKNRQIAANLLVAFFTAILALLDALGYGLGLDEETIFAGASFVAALVNSVLTLATSATVGIGRRGDPVGGLLHDGGGTTQDEDGYSRARSGPGPEPRRGSDPDDLPFQR